MTIPIPITKTKIATVAWGIPITNEVNLATTFRVAQAVTAWTNATLVNSWIPYDASYPAQYRKVGDSVEVRGMIKNGAVSTIAFTLPVGFRPYQEQTFPIASSGAFAIVSVSTAGAVNMGWNVNPATAYLSGIRFSTIA